MTTGTRATRIGPRRARRLALGASLAVLLAVCGVPEGPGGSGQPAPSGSPPAALSGPPTQTPPSASRHAPFPDLDVLVGTADGDVYAKLVGGKPAGPKVHVCDGFIVRIETAGGADALISCIAGPAFAVYTYDPRTGAVARLPNVDGPAIWTGGPILGAAILYVTRGGCPPAATDCAQRLVRRDMRTGVETVIDERIGVVTDFQLTAEGPTVWRAKITATYVRPDAEVGTYVLRGTALTRFSAYRLVAGRQGRWLLESEETESFNSGCCTFVVQRAQSETRITPAGVPNERALALLPGGGLLAFRPDGDGAAGVMVTYAPDGGTIERTDRGAFLPFRTLWGTADWILGMGYAGTVPLTVHAFRIGDGAFAVATLDATALAAVPAK